MNKVQEYIYNLLSATKRRGEWYCFNCPSCCRFGEKRPDYKQRAGINFTGEGLVYNCFNCKMTWGWQPGSHMSQKFRMFLEDMGLSYQQIMDVRKIIDEYLDTTEEHKEVEKKRVIRSIPDGFKSIKQSLFENNNSQTLRKIYGYITSRSERLLEWEDLLWKEDVEAFLIPVREFGKVVGYSLRNIINETDHKYIHYIPSGCLYNFDNLLKPRKYQIVVEGQLDALAIDGIGILSNTFTDDKLKRLLDYKGDAEIIILPDRDEAGKKIVQQVLENNLPFSISFPNWEKGIKDAFDAVRKYGRLYTIYDIINSRESDKTKIKIKEGSWFNV